MQKIKAIYFRVLGALIDVNGTLTVLLLAVATGLAGAFFSSHKLVVAGGFLLAAAIGFSAASAALGLHTSACYLDSVQEKLTALYDGEVKMLTRARSVPAPDPRKPN